MYPPPPRPTLFPTTAPFRPSTGVTGRQLQRLVPIVTRLARLFVQYDMTLAEINPLAEMEDGSFVALDAHMDMENEARGRQGADRKSTRLNSSHANISYAVFC